MEKNYDFDVSFTCRHEENDEIFRNLAVGQVLKLSRYHKHIVDCDIKIDKQNTSFTSEIILHVPGHTLRAEHKDFNQIKAFDASIEKVKVQLKKLKSKVVDHRVNTQLEKSENPELEESETPE